MSRAVGVVVVSLSTPERSGMLPRVVRLNRLPQRLPFPCACIGTIVLNELRKWALS